MFVIDEADEGKLVSVLVDTLSREKIVVGCQFLVTVLLKAKWFDGNVGTTIQEIFTTEETSNIPLTIGQRHVIEIMMFKFLLMRNTMLL